MTKRTKVERMTPKNLRAFRIEGGDRILSALQPPQYREIHAKGTHANSQASFSPRLSCSYPAPRCSGSIHGSHGAETLLSIGQGAHRGLEPLRFVKGHPIRQTERPSRS